jgi:fructokinase
MRNDPVLCFGEILWDCLPKGRFLGGAPLNVAYHLARLGRHSVLVSSVGQDELGQEALAAIKAGGIDGDTVSLREDLPTGTVDVRLSPEGHAGYTINQPVAWDRISTLPVEANRAAALVFGSLSLRQDYNREALRALRKLVPGRHVCDINLRAPFDDVAPLMQDLRAVDLLKVNEDEAYKLTRMNPAQDKLESVLLRLCELFGCEIVCVTLGGEGALLWDRQTFHRAAAPKVKVQDTIGAGDAFCAALVDGWLSMEDKPNWGQILARACRLGAYVATCSGAQPNYSAAQVLA